MALFYSHVNSPVNQAVSGGIWRQKGEFVSLELTEIPVEGYERVVHFVDTRAGLNSYISVHDTTLGPALGGMRMWPYATETEALEDANRLGTLGAAAMMFGSMERALELAVAYTSERQAFGVPIASFQALQHRAADMFIKTESTRSSVFRAAWAEENAPQEASYLCSVAKAWAGPAGRFVCGQAIQLHGGVGFTWEYDLHIYLKRVKTLELFYGSTRSQVEATLAGSAEYQSARGGSA